MMEADFAGMGGTAGAMPILMAGEGMIAGDTGAAMIPTARMTGSPPRRLKARWRS